ncbi:MAG: hypothetical protein LAO20_19190 [Acidobacteriia bacterium]|nr:hypothetical protein [Terriglobia bacterium]
MLYPEETVRLLRELPGVTLPKDAEGAVVSVTRNQQGELVSADVRFHSPAGTQVVTVPCDALQPVISRASQDRTAVLWGLEIEPEKLIESALHSIMDRGFTMREGVNIARLHYDLQERWWKWGERLADPSGAHLAASGHTWDGCVAALSGDERFHLEFRLRGRGEAVVLLHEHDEAYARQARRTEPAMRLARVLGSLCSDIAAEFCVFPVADPWLMDEDWKSLLRAPFYQDFMLLPEASSPAELPEEFRVARLTSNRLMLTALPVKFDPADPPMERTDRDLKLARLRKCQALGEKYYDQMYETRFGTTGLYSSAKEAFYDAISTANELGLANEARTLEARLANIKGVFRSQFS